MIGCHRPFTHIVHSTYQSFFKSALVAHCLPVELSSFLWFTYQQAPSTCLYTWRTIYIKRLQLAYFSSLKVPQISRLNHTITMARTGFFHHFGTFLLLVATVLLIVTCISAPVINEISIMKVDFGRLHVGGLKRVTFGTFGWCEIADGQA